MGVFDEAFTSRIHVSIQYKDLTNSDREKIWMNNFQRLENFKDRKIEVEAPVKTYVKESKDILELEWNGRDIRNGKSTAEEGNLLV
jgi:hypothetical protein